MNELTEQIMEQIREKEPTCEICGATLIMKYESSKEETSVLLGSYVTLTISYSYEFGCQRCGRMFRRATAYEAVKAYCRAEFEEEIIEKGEY